MSEVDVDESKQHHVALKRAKKIRSFYRSLLLFLLIVLLLLINHFIPERYNNGYVWILIIWGLYLIYQGFNFFVPGLWVFNDNWEKKYVDKKIKQDEKRGKSKAVK
jgi:hypothetical protein